MQFPARAAPGQPCREHGTVRTRPSRGRAAAGRPYGPSCQGQGPVGAGIVGAGCARPGTLLFRLHFHRPCADRAARAALAGAGIDGGFPDVALGAAPPDLFFAAAGDLIGGERSVHLVVPLRRNLRREGGKVVKARKHPAPRAVGAAGAALFGPGVDGGLPGVALVAPPPDGAAHHAAVLHGLTPFGRNSYFVRLTPPVHQANPRRLLAMPPNGRSKADGSPFFGNSSGGRRFCHTQTAKSFAKRVVTNRTSCAILKM